MTKLGMYECLRKSDGIDDDIQLMCSLIMM